MSVKPTFVFIPGNFLPPDYYAGVARLLESHSFPTQLVTIASTGSDTPLPSNEPDIAAARTILEHLVDAGKELILIGHSYGAIPMCEAAKGLGRHEKKARGETGGIAKLIFIAAWLLQEGESPPAIISKHSMEASWARFDEVNVYAEDPIYALHHDTSADIAAYWAPYTAHSDLAAFGTPLSYAAWRYIPSTYVLCELDRCILPRVQEDMIAVAKGRVKVEKIQSGHMPMLSMPDKLAELLIKEADETM